MLRHPQVQSKVEDLASGGFKEIIDDKTAKASAVKKVIFTSGRLYYDLEKYKVENGITNVAVVRMEQIFPIPNKQINEILKKYNKSSELIWAQDEPENMGAWPFIHRKLGCLGFKVVSRPESASPAAGLMEKHKQSLDLILHTAFKQKELAV